MKKGLIASTAVVLVLSASSAMAASETAQVNASLTISGECEVIATNISATSDNFVSDDVALVQGSSLSAGSFDNYPTGLTVDPASTVAVLCSASSTDHTLTLASSGSSLSDGATGTIAWSPAYAPLATPETTSTITDDSSTSISLTGNPSEAELYEYIITAGVAADDIANVNPGAYSGTITATVSYGTP